MRLDYDCLRKVLLTLEKTLKCEYKNNVLFFNDVSIDDVFNELKGEGFTKEDVFYAAYNLEQAKYIEAETVSGDNGIFGYMILDITYEGHQFLGKIKPDSVWKQIKNALGKVGSVSLPIISSVATSLSTSLIKSQLGLS